MVAKRQRGSKGGNLYAQKETRLKKAEVKVGKPMACELQMECMDDDLSPAQLKAIELAKIEHEKANELIKTIRAGNILVPSSQPNTFTIVPPKAPILEPPILSTPNSKVLFPIASSSVTVVSDQRGLPPPRPVQFLNKQQQGAKPQLVKASPDIIIISESPPQAAGSTLSPPQTKSTLRSPQLQAMTLIPGSGQNLQMPIFSSAGATPQQVFKLVSLPSNQPANLITKKLANRPLLMVPPQQQTFIQSGGITTPALMQMPTLGSPSPRQMISSGEWCDTKGGWNDSLVKDPVKYNVSLQTNRTRSSYEPYKQQRTSSNVRNWDFPRFSRINRVVTSLAVSWKRNIHIVQVAEHFNKDKACQAYRVSHVQFDVLKSVFIRKHKLKKCRQIFRCVETNTLSSHVTSCKAVDKPFKCVNDVDTEVSNKSMESKCRWLKASENVTDKCSNCDRDTEHNHCTACVKENTVIFSNNFLDTKRCCPFKFCDYFQSDFNDLQTGHRCYFTDNHTATVPVEKLRFLNKNEKTGVVGFSDEYKEHLEILDLVKVSVSTEESLTGDFMDTEKRDNLENAVFGLDHSSDESDSNCESYKLCSGAINCAQPSHFQSTFIKFVNRDSKVHKKASAQEKTGDIFDVMRVDMSSKSSCDDKSMVQTFVTKTGSLNGFNNQNCDIINVEPIFSGKPCMSIEVESNQCCTHHTWAETSKANKELNIFNKCGVGFKFTQMDTVDINVNNDGAPMKNICNDLKEKKPVSVTSLINRYSQLHQTDLTFNNSIRTTDKFGQKIENCRQSNLEGKNGNSTEMKLKLEEEFNGTASKYNKSGQPKEETKVKVPLFTAESSNSHNHFVFEDLSKSCSVKCMPKSDDFMPNELSKSKKFTWYQNISWEDIVYTVVMCCKYGFTMMSKKLQIPKTQLLKWSRTLKKINFVCRNQKMDSCQVSEKDLTAKSSDAKIPSIQTKYKNVKWNSTLIKLEDISKNHGGMKMSLLKTYFPTVYLQACKLLSELENNSYDIEIGTEQEHLAHSMCDDLDKLDMADESREISDESLEICQVHQLHAKPYEMLLLDQSFCDIAEISPKRLFGDKRDHDDYTDLHIDRFLEIDHQQHCSNETVDVENDFIRNFEVSSQIGNFNSESLTEHFNADATLSYDDVSECKKTFKFHEANTNATEMTDCLQTIMTVKNVDTMCENKVEQCFSGTTNSLKTNISTDVNIFYQDIKQKTVEDTSPSCNDIITTVGRIGSGVTDNCYTNVPPQLISDIAALDHNYIGDVGEGAISLNPTSYVTLYCPDKWLEFGGTKLLLYDSVLKNKVEILHVIGNESSRIFIGNKLHTVAEDIYGINSIVMEKKEDCNIERINRKLKLKLNKAQKILFSTNLRIKLANLCKRFGIYHVAKEYNIKSKTLRTWCNLLKNNKLPNYDLVNDELLELVEYNIQKLNNVNVSNIYYVKVQKTLKRCAEYLHRIMGNDDNTRIMLKMQNHSENVNGSTHTIELMSFIQNEYHFEDIDNKTCDFGSVSEKKDSTNNKDQINGTDTTCVPSSDLHEEQKSILFKLLNNSKEVHLCRDDSEDRESELMQKQDAVNVNSQIIKQVDHGNIGVCTAKTDLNDVKYVFEQDRNHMNEDFEQISKNGYESDTSDDIVEICSWDKKDNSYQNLNTLPISVKGSESGYMIKNCVPFNKLSFVVENCSEGKGTCLNRLKHENQSTEQSRYLNSNTVQHVIDELNKDASVETFALVHVPDTDEEVTINESADQSGAQVSLLSKPVIIKDEPFDEIFDKIEKRFFNQEITPKNDKFIVPRHTVQKEQASKYNTDKPNHTDENSNSCGINALGLGNENQQSQGYSFSQNSKSSESGNQNTAFSGSVQNVGSVGFSTDEHSSGMENMPASVLSAHNMPMDQEVIVLDPKQFTALSLKPQGSQQSCQQTFINYMHSTGEQTHTLNAAGSQVVAGMTAYSNSPLQCSVINSPSTLLGKINQNIKVCQPGNETDEHRNSICVPRKTVLLGSKNVVVPSDILQQKQFETIGFFSRPTSQILTIHSMGSISKETIPVTSSMLQTALTQPFSSTNTKVQVTSTSSGHDSVQYFTPIQDNDKNANPNVIHIDDNEIDKQRTLLKAMHEHKSKLHVGGEAYCGTLTSEVSSSAKFVNSAALQTKQMNSNRINTLIKTVTSRVNSNQINSIVNQTASNFGKNQSHTKMNEPLTASEILFGKRTSAQTTRAQVKEKVKSSDVAKVEESSSESSSSVSTVSAKSSESRTNVTDDKLDRESINLSDKLKSLLKADIFSSFECDVNDQQESEADELIELLAGSPEKKNEFSLKTTSVLNNQKLWSEKKCKEQPLDNQSCTASSKLVYSDTLQKKLGKLCTIFSIASISKKYGVNPRTLSKWEAMYKDEEIAGLELTAKDKKELQEISAFKTKYICARDTDYQIYFDNPELDYDEAGENKNISQNIDEHTSNTCQENRYSQEDVAPCSSFTKDNVEPKKQLFCSKTAENVSICHNVGSSLESSTKKPAEIDPDAVPLYIAAADSMPENLRQHMRQKIKCQKPIDASLKKSVFMASDCNVSTSSKGSETDKMPECTDNIAKTVIMNKSHSVSEILLTCKENHGASSLVKAAVLPTSAGEGTLYLCPTEGDSQNKYVSIETSSCQKQEPSKIVHPDISKKSNCNTETQGQNSQVIVESDVPLRSFDSRSSLSSLKDSIVVDNVEDVGLKDNVDVKYSESFKWKVVEEARKSGFENTAKWFLISMTDIMKWHDSFLRKKPIKESEPNCSPSVPFDLSPVRIEIDSANESNIEHAEVEAVSCSKKGLNAGLLFEQFRSKEGAIKKPRFNTSTLNKPSQSIESLANTMFLPVTNKQKTRANPSAIKYLLAKSPSSSQKQGHNVVYDVQYQADVQRDLGIMPKLVKPTNVSLLKDDIEIASTWKQVQSLLKPAKSSEKKYSQEFKNRMIKECEQKGQKIVSKEHKIPYNELSRWRLEAKKVPLVFQSNISATQSTMPASIESSPGQPTANKETVNKKVITAVDTSSALVTVEEDGSLGSKLQESLKIKIKLSNLPDRSKLSSNKNLILAKDKTKTNFVEDEETIRKSSAYFKSIETNFSHPSNSKEPDAFKKGSLRVKNSQNVEEAELSEQEQMKMTVINYCFDQGVLKTQKKFNFTRQSILDLIKEYEAVNKNTSDDEYNYHKIIRTLRTRLVSREKTSVEDAAVDTRQPILVKNLNDYIVTQEYKHNVVDYSRKHGITAASRKFKRKSSTVRRWITEFQKVEKKKITVEQEHRQRELMITQNMSFDEAKKIAQLQAVRKRKLLEMEFRKHIVAFAKEFGITAATKKFKRKAQVVKSWMGHFEKSERDTKRLTELKQTEDPNQSKIQILEKQGNFQAKPLNVPQLIGLHGTSGLLALNNNSHSSLWDQDFIIKPNSNDSPLKLTLSPRRKSSPKLAVGSSTKDDVIIEGDLVDDEMDDFEIEDQEDDGQYVEVCAWEEPHDKNKEVASIDLTDNDDQNMHEKRSDKSLNLQSVACTSDAKISTQTPDNLVLSYLDHSVSMKQSNKQPETDSFISPTDVPNIFDMRHQAEHENIKNTSEESTYTVPEIDKVVDAESLILQDGQGKAVESCSNLFSVNDIIVSQIPDRVMLNQDANGLNKETDANIECVELDEYVPYEETIIFKLLTAEVDNFFNMNLPGSCDIVETNNIAQQNQTKITFKKTKRTADFEIMENIEETCLFNAPRSSRNIVRENESVSDDTLFTKNCKTDHVEKIDNAKGIETKNVIGTEKQSDCAVTNQLEISRNVQLENSHEDFEVGSENETKFERSLFDFFNMDENVKGEQTEDNLSEKSKIVSNEQTPVQATKGTSFSIFGNIFKNVKIPSSLIMKAQNNASANETNTGCIVRSQDEIKMETNSDAVNDNKAAESGERNLFDMISLQSENKEKVDTGMVTKESTSPIEKPIVKDNMLQAGIKTSIFKFPKLALPINFGNIAKLGLAKMKKDEKATKTELLDEINPKDETSINKNTVMVNEKLPNNQNDKCSLKTKSDQTCVVMETFEELRKRLAKERAANRQAKEKLIQESVHETIDKNITDVIENVGCVDGKDSSVLNEGDIDYEIYKDFTSEKIILILDIARKHGIEFASTSFDLPVSVIVNWIMEKDRKHRRVNSSENLEQKLQVVREVNQLKLDINEVANKYEVDPSNIEKWKLEIGWLLENKNVLGVLDKWLEDEPVSRLSLEICGMTSCKESISSEANSVNSSSDIKQEMENINICDRTEKQEMENINLSDRTENILSARHDVDANLADPFQTSESGAPLVTKLIVPEILSFTKTLNPRDYTIEQKSMIVILIDKYGLREVNKRLSLNTGTLWSWKNQNKAIKQYLEEQTKVFHKPKNAENGIAFTSSSRKEKLAESVQHNIVRKKHQFEKSKSTKSSIASTSSKASSTNKDLDFNVIQGYRIISPTKLPPVLRDCQKIPTKDYTFDQRVAIVKLVELYGVRTIHKQFKISQGSIWNWQHDKKIMAEISKQKLFNDKTENVGLAQACLAFDEVDCQPINMDTILDRVLVAVESTDHLKFTADQKADVVCMIQHFGLDYVAEKMPNIPKGTIWNWQHNKIVLPLVDKKMELLRKSLKSQNQKNVMSVAVDKIDLTEKWLNDCQASGRKRKVGQGDETGDHLKKRKIQNIDHDKQILRNTCDRNVFDDDSLSSTGLKIDTNPDRMKNRIHSEKRQKHYSSSSTISSETSIHSEDFEEIVSEDEKMTELSLTSSKSKIDVNTLQHSAKYVQKSNKGNASVKSADSYSLTLDHNNTEIQPKYEVLKLDCERDGRIMVCYTIVNGQEADAMKQKPVETGNKRSATGPVGTPPPAKRKIVSEEELGVTDTEGNWLSLDEYYYGIQEGSAEYTEDKGEYRFKCWYCSKMLYNNVRAMQHIQGHIDASKQQHIDLSDSTQCKYCYKQFDTSFEMQTHVEKVHLSNKVLMCRICEKDFGTARELMHHMGTSHHANEMPYLCQLCNFRSSMYSDVVDHFKKKHDSSHHLLCLYCLRTFQVKFCSQGWGQTQTFYGHLLKHMSKSSTKRCITCRLTFFNITDVKNHKRLCHGWNQKEDPQKSSQSSKQDSFQRGRKKGTSLKSLNAPSISKIQDYSDVIFPSEVNTAKCVECKLSMSSMDHYKKFIHCSMCRFATSCSVAYANHMMGFHSGQMSSLNLNIPWERPMKELMYCNCGFPSKYGNKIANHLVFCTKTTCCSSKPRLLTLEGSDEKKEDGKKEDSLLGMLGMVQKKSVTTRVRTNQDKKEQQKKVPGPQSKKTVKMGKRKPGPKSKTTDIVDWKTDTPESKYSKIEQIDDVIVLDEERDKEDKDIVIVETTPTKLKALHDDTSSSKTDRVVGEVKDVQTEMESKIVTEVKEDMKIEDKINLQKTEDNIEDELKMESESQVVNAVKEGLNKESNSDEMFELEASGCKIEMPETIDISKNKTFNENLENTFDVSSAAKDSENNTFAGLEIVDSCNQNSSFTGLVENQKEAMDERTMDPVNGSGPMEKHFESGQENIVEPQQLPQKFEHEMEVEEHDEQEMNIIQNNVSETDLNPDNTENFDINAMEVETDNHNLNERPSVHDDHKMEFTCAEETKNVNLEEPKVDCKNLEVQTVKEGIATEVLQECKQAKEQCKSNSVTIKDQKQTADKLESDLLQDKAHSSNQILDTIGDQLEESKEKERTKHHSGECHRERQTSSVGQRDILQCKDGLKRHNPSEQGVASDHSTNKLDSRDHLLPVASQSEDKSRQKQEYKPHYDSKGRHNDKSSSYHSSQRADSYHSGRQSYDSRGYDRNRDLSLSNRDYRQDNRQGYGHQDNRDQGYGGSRGHQGSYNDYRGNLDNRSRGNYRGGQGYGNRGGYNQQKYRDSYGGGYY